MAVLAPLGVMVALPAGATGVAALLVLAVAMLDVVAVVALLPLLRTAGALLAQIVVALRLVYAAVFATAAGQLLGDADLARFQAIWDAGSWCSAPTSCSPAPRSCARRALPAGWAQSSRPPGSAMQPTPCSSPSVRPAGSVSSR